MEIKELKLEFSVSATTRAPRGQEVDGKDYYFLSVSDFQKKIADNQFVEYEQVYEGRYYGTLRSELDRMRALIEGKRQIGVYPFYDPDIWLANGKASSLYDLHVLGAEGWRPLLYIGVPFTFREKDASLLLLSGRSARAVPKDALAAWRARGVIEDGAAAAEVGRDGRTFVFGKGAWSDAVWTRGASLEIKDALDRLAGGRMPSRVDTCVRMAQSVWESPDGSERVVFLFNLDYDDATDVRLTADGSYEAEGLSRGGEWRSIGSGDTFAVPRIPAWSPAVIRLKRGGFPR
jgi:hypothetical protein